MTRPVAIFTSDWHIWPTAPLYRAVETDWFQVMSRPIKEIKRFQRKNDGIPVFIAGDIFDYYNPAPEIINWLMKNLPQNCYAIPGQHDLQNHSLDLLTKTAFWTLVQSKKINYLDPAETHIIQSNDIRIQVESKPWKAEVARPTKLKDIDCLVYIAHQYIYAGQKTHYQGAPTTADINRQKSFLEEVDVAVFGDNHIPFQYKVGNTQILNCGTMIRRKVDERHYPVGYFVLYDDLTVERKEFDTRKDLFSNIELRPNKDKKDSEKIAAELLKELEKIDTISIDFEQELFKELEKNRSHEEVKEIAIEIFNKYKEEKK